MEEDKERRSKKTNQMEKSIQTIMLAVITAGVLYFGNTVVSTANDVSLIKFQVGEINKKSDGFVTRNEIELRSKDRDEKMAIFEKRISILEADARGVPIRGN